MLIIMIGNIVCHFIPALDKTIPVRSSMVNKIIKLMGNINKIEI